MNIHRDPRRRGEPLRVIDCMPKWGDVPAEPKGLTPEQVLAGFRALGAKKRKRKDAR